MGLFAEKSPIYKYILIDECQYREPESVTFRHPRTTCWVLVKAILPTIIHLVLPCLIPDRRGTTRRIWYADVHNHLQL